MYIDKETICMICININYHKFSRRQIQGYQAASWPKVYVTMPLGFTDRLWNPRNNFDKSSVDLFTMWVCMYSLRRRELMINEVLVVKNLQWRSIRVRLCLCQKLGFYEISMGGELHQINQIYSFLSFPICKYGFFEYHINILLINQNQCCYFYIENQYT